MFSLDKRNYVMAPIVFHFLFSTVIYYNIVTGITSNFRDTKRTK